MDPKQSSGFYLTVADLGRLSGPTFERLWSSLRAAVDELRADRTEVSIADRPRIEVAPARSDPKPRGARRRASKPATHAPTRNVITGAETGTFASAGMEETKTVVYRDQAIAALRELGEKNGHAVELVDAAIRHFVALHGPGRQPDLQEILREAFHLRRKHASPPTILAPPPPAAEPEPSRPPLGHPGRPYVWESLRDVVVALGGSPTVNEAAVELLRTRDGIENPGPELVKMAYNRIYQCANHEKPNVFARIEGGRVRLTGTAPTVAPKAASPANSHAAVSPAASDGERPDPKTCPHHWVIEPQNGPTARGTCKLCKISRDDFRNSIPESFNGEKPEAALDRRRRTRETRRAVA